MLHLESKKILLGVTGSIASYKTPDLVRRLREHGADVRVVMSNHAREFITPMTLQAVSGHQVHDALLNPEFEAAMGHIELARWADAYLIAPASADCIARFAQGYANDLLSAVYLATEKPVLIAPAMNQAMWQHPATQENVSTLQSREVTFLGPASGEQACGDVGPGRLLEPEIIVDFLDAYFTPKQLHRRKVVITAGPTREAIDPVRYLSNHSSGKMGYALAKAAYEAGADVILISGPVALNIPYGVHGINVESAQEMYDCAMLHAKGSDLFIGCAAVADYRCQEIATQKISKESENMTLTLIRNPDILAAVARLEDRPFCIGFAAQTSELEPYARAKLQNKNVDLMIANRVDQTDYGFGSDYNQVHVFSKIDEQLFEKEHKTMLAKRLMNMIIERMYNEKAKNQSESIR